MPTIVQGLARGCLILGLAIDGAVGALAETQATTEFPPLAPGTSVEHTLDGGRHHHPLAAGPGWWRVDIEQLGIDVVVELLDGSVELLDGSVELLDGSGARLLRIDGPFDSQGTERLTFDLATGETRTLVVAPRDPAASAGRYRVILSPAPEDPDLLAAEIDITAAGAAHAEALASGDDEPVRRARRLLDRALEVQRNAGDLRRLAETLHQRGLLLRRLDERPAAERDLQEALNLWRTLDARSFEATAANDLGLLLRDRGEGREAETLIRQAVALYLELGDTANATIAEVNLCLLHLDEGELEAARDCYLRIVEPLRRAGARYHLANVLNSLGGLAFQQSQPDEAKRRFGEAFELFQTQGDLEGQATAVANRAALERSLGRWQAALADYGRALELQRQTGDRRGEARTLNNIGHAYLLLGETERALDHFEEALPIRREVGHRSGEAVTLTNLGTVYQRLGNPAKALVFHRHALDLRRQLERRRGEARTRIWIARDLRLLGDRTAAHDELALALELFGSLQDRRYQAVALADRGRLWLDEGRLDEARRDLEEALTIQREVRDPWSEANTLLSLAEVARARGATGRAFVLAEQTLTLVEGLRRGVGIPELQATFFDTRQRIGDLAIALAMERHRQDPTQGHDRLAFTLSERLRGRTLIDLLDRSGIEPRGSVDPEPLERRRGIADQLRMLANRRLVAGSRGDREAATQLDSEIARLTAEADRLDAALRDTPTSPAETQRPLGIPGIQELLGPEVMLLEIALGEPESFGWVVTASDFVSYRLPGRHELEELAQAAYRELSTLELTAHAGGDGPRAAPTTALKVEALSHALLDPLLDSLLGQSATERPERLLVVADGALHSVPFAALSLGGDQGLLVDHFAIAHLPSATVVGSLRASAFETRSHARQLAVLADPILGASDPRLSPTTTDSEASTASENTRAAPGDAVVASFPRLVGSRREAEAITALVPSDARWLALGADAHRGALTGSEVASARIVHLATHALIDGKRPETSGLLLSRLDAEGRELDGFVGLREIYDLHLQADTVVLSGCRTAQGRAVRGEGLMGLTHGLFHAGARRIVASLWRVDDAATAVLMEDFYQALLVEGQTSTKALRNAQRTLRSDPRFRDPYYWAAWVVQGEP